MTTASHAIKTSVSKDGLTATVSVPVTFLQRGGRKQILMPPGEAPWSSAPRVDTALLKAIVRAHRWRHKLESGEYASSADLAKAEGINESYLCRVLRLTLLGPDVVEAILQGGQPRMLELQSLLKPLPADWGAQRKALGFANGAGPSGHPADRG
jgi:hypothetical protein